MQLPSWIHDRRSVLALFALAWVISRCGILYSVDPDESDVELYFRYAVQGVDNHQVPYRDFTVEYPPVAYWFIALPRWIDASPVPAGTFDHPLKESAAFHRYGYLYEGQAVICDLLAFVLLLAMARRRWPEHLIPLGVGYLAVTTFLWPVMFTRLDIGLTALLMGWAWLWLKAGDGSASAGRSRLASYAVLGLSISFKLIPVLMTPFLLLAELRSPRPWRQTAQAVLVLATSALVPFAIHLPSAGADVGKLFSYHGQRGIQVESLYASVLALSTAMPLELELSFGSWNVVTDWTPALKHCSTLLLLAFLAALGLWSLFEGRRFTRERAFCAACLALGGAVILAKVLSPQYFVWALPVMLILSAQVLPPRWTNCWLAAAGMMAVARTTTWIFPHHYGQLLDTHLWRAPWLVLAARNAVYLLLTAWLATRWLATSGPVHLPNLVALWQRRRVYRLVRRLPTLGPPAASGG
jgi:hypothetical protein